jgi:hypothetical protein
MPETIPLPADAAEFIRRRNDALRKRWRYICLFLWLIALVPMVYRLCLVPLPPDVPIYARAITLFLPFSPLAILFWLFFRGRVARLARDAACDHLNVASGEFEKCPERGRGGMAGEQGVFVAGALVMIPATAWDDLPEKGTMVAEYFPHTKLGWRLDGRKMEWR